MNGGEIRWVQAYFVHERLLLGLLDEPRKLRLRHHISSVEGLTSPQGALAYGYESILSDYLSSFGIPELAVLAASGVALDNVLVVWTQAVYLKREGESLFMHASLDVDPGQRVESRLSRERLIGNSARSEFSGRRRITVLGIARRDGLNPNRIELTTVFAGNVDFSGVATRRSITFDDRREVHAQLIDQFAPDGEWKRPSAGELAIIRKMPEEEVKNGFALIVGEASTLKDWGGERSDLFTDKLTIQGAPVTAAFAFKGPGQQGRLTVARMGKNGDQGLRLAQEPCDLLIVQHYREIDSAVRNLMSAVARNSGKRFCIIDGAETARIFRDKGII